MLGAAERLSILIVQLALSLIVIQVFIQGQIRLLILAVIWHTFIDAAAVLAINFISPILVEIMIGVFAIISLITIYALRTPEPFQSQIEPYPTPDIGQINLDITNQKIEYSRYE